MDACLFKFCDGTGRVHTNPIFTVPKPEPMRDERGNIVMFTASTKRVIEFYAKPE